MLQKLKVAFLRHFYRFSNARAWKGHRFGKAYATTQAATSVGSLDLRIYQGELSGELPLIVYFHGGGWVLGDLDTHSPFCEALCHRSGSTVVAVDYRLAPEHPYPAAHDDCLAATRWIAAHAEAFDSTNGTLVLAGDSAGANLATAACLELDPDVRRSIAGQILIYPVVAHYESGWSSYRKKTSGLKLTGKMMAWFWDTYQAGNGGENTSHRPPERATPLNSDQLGSLPPTLIVTAEHDPLRDEGIAYARKLGEAGVEVDYRHFDDATHGFVCSEGPTDDFEAFIGDAVGWLRRLEPGRQ